MENNTVARGVRVGFLAAVFAAGFLCGGITRRPADAQLKKLESAMKNAGQSGTVADPKAQLGATLVDIQQHVDALQKNIVQLHQVKSALGG